MEINWDELNARIAACENCGLCGAIRNKVPGQGNPSARLMFIGEGPGAEEDARGLAFVGAAGQLLTKMIRAMGFAREDVFIANVVKCRPPGNRAPTEDEAAACLPFLRAQYALVRPRVIVLLGATAARTLISPDFRVTRDRGKWIERKGVWFMPTYHPAALLRDESKKRETWADLKQVMEKLGGEEDAGHTGSERGV